jgi:hypothetical protein
MKNHSGLPCIDSLLFCVLVAVHVRHAKKYIQDVYIYLYVISDSLIYTGLLISYNSCLNSSI